MELTNRSLGLLVGLALLAAGLLAVIEMILAVTGQPGWVIDRGAWAQTAGQLQWGDRTLVIVALIAGVVGLVLALLQLWPLRPRLVPLASEEPDRRNAIDGRGLQELLRRAAVEDEDVLGADVAVRRRRAKVKVHAPPDADAKAVRARVGERLASRIDALGLRRRLSPRVKVERTRERVR